MNIVEIFAQFPTQRDCITHLERARWPNGTSRCPYCQSTHTTRLQHRHHCYACKTSFSVTVGTIFHRTHLPLQKWFFAVSLILNAKKGVVAMQLSRDLRVNKNTAWRIAMQIRKAMAQKEHRDLLTGVVEMDETYVGGKLHGNPSQCPPGTAQKSRTTSTKPPIIGAVSRGVSVTVQEVMP